MAKIDLKQFKAIIDLAEQLKAAGEIGPLLEKAAEEKRQAEETFAYAREQRDKAANELAFMEEDTKQRRAAAEAKAQQVKAKIAELEAQLTADRAELERLEKVRSKVNAEIKQVLGGFSTAQRETSANGSKAKA